MGELVEQVEDGRGVFLVETARRLVEQQDLGLAADGTRDGQTPAVNLPKLACRRVHERFVVLDGKVAAIAETGLVQQVTCDIGLGLQEVAAGRVHRVHKVGDGTQVVADCIALRHHA